RATRKDPSRAGRGRGLTVFRTLALVAMIALIGVAYSGAYVRHTGAELACVSWPTCNGKVIPEFDGLAGIQTIHRLAVLGISLLLAGVLYAAYRLRSQHPDLLMTSAIAMVLLLV